MSRFTNNKRSNTFDNVQLRQKIIHLQSELSRYKEQLAKYENNYHYTKFEQLINENNEMKQRIKILEKESSNKSIDQSHLVEEINIPFAGEHLTEKKDQEMDHLKQEILQLKQRVEQLQMENEQLHRKTIKQNEQINNMTELLSINKRKQAVLNENMDLEDHKDNVNESWFLRTIKQQHKPK